MADRENLERLIGIAEGKLTALGAFPGSGSMDVWREWRQREEAMTAELEREERAAIRRSGDAHRMVLGGVSTSCTSGRSGLVRNWINAARRRIEAGAS